MITSPSIVSLTILGCTLNRPGGVIAFSAEDTAGAMVAVDRAGRAAAGPVQP